jgi:acetoin utilization deacetylase AcuC-like enzyme
VRFAEGAAGVVLALGVDAAATDPESPLEVGVAGFREAGRLIGALSVPTVVVQEGGYDLESLGPLVREALLGLEEGRL